MDKIIKTDLNTNIKTNNFNINIFNTYLSLYIKNFSGNFKDEKYKWQAIKHFQNTWDENAPNFMKMFLSATSEHHNLLDTRQYRPRKMLSDYANALGEAKIKELFINLYNESIDLKQRLTSFFETINELNEKYDNGKWQSYNDARAVSVYLWMRYPDKYYIFKLSIFEEVKSILNLNYNFVKGRHIDNIINGLNMIDEIKSRLIKNQNLIKLYQSHLDETCDEDKNFNTLTQDFLHFISSKQYGGEMENIFLNQILYGPPGTGKTYSTSSIVKKILSSNKVSINKRSPKEITKETPWWQAIALSMYQNDKDKKYKVSELELLLQDYTPLKNNKTVKNKIWEQLQKHTDFSSETVFAKDRNEPYVFDKSKDSEWFLTEKGINYINDQLINEEQVLVPDEITDKYIGFITFHQSYSYEEFVEGIKPSTKDEKIKYSIENGIFKKMCIKANSDPENNYVIVIDEINRGNISKIFGELITLIEKDKRIIPNGANDIDDNDLNLDDTSRAEHSIIVKLPYSQKDFGVPSNLYIIGTMNTSDRSIASIDIALRRRFKFVEMMPKPEKLVDENNQPLIVDSININLQELLQILNERISYLLDRDHQIGHSYFMNWKNYDLATLKDVWFDEIMPLLNEYFYSDWDKLQAILGEAKEKDSEKSFIIKIKKPDLPYDIDCNDEDAYYDFSKKQDVNNEDFKKMLEHAKLIKTKSNESTETN